MKYRKVNLVVMIAAIILSAIKIGLSLKRMEIMYVVLLNVIVNLIFITTIVLYTRFRKINFSRSFGAGDVLFLVIAGLNLGSTAYVLFICLSSFIGLGFYFFSVNKEGERKTIPFAGLMAGLLSLVVVLELLTGYSAYSEYVLMQIKL